VKDDGPYITGRLPHKGNRTESGQNTYWPLQRTREVTAAVLRNREVRIVKEVVKCLISKVAIDGGGAKKGGLMS